MVDYGTLREENSQTTIVQYSVYLEDRQASLPDCHTNGDTLTERQNFQNIPVNSDI